MPKILGNLDLNKNELQNAILQPLASAPSSPKEGQIYYNSTDKNLYRYNGTTWVTYQNALEVENVEEVSIDTSVTPNSSNLITSGAVATAISNIDVLPSQTGNSGKFLTTNGTNASWASLPKEIFWCTYGSTSFSEIQTAIQSLNQFCALDYLGKIYIYTYGDYGDYSYHYFINVTGNKINKITVSDMNQWSGPVSTTIDSLPSQTGHSGDFLTTNGTAASWADAAAVTTLTVDGSPVSNSTNLITSGGVYSAVESAKDIYWCSVSGTTPTDTPSNIVSALSNNKICAFKLSNNEQYICSSITPSTGVSWCNFFNITYTPSPTGLSTTYGMKVWRLTFDNSDYTIYTWESENVPNALASVFVCTYGSTRTEEIETAYQAGKICIMPLTTAVMDGSTTACAVGEIYILTYRKSATEHKFTSVIPWSSNGKFTFSSLWCNNDTWSIGYYDKDPFTAASTSAAGIVQLSSSTSSTSTSYAATSSAVKSAYDRAATLTGRTVAPSSADTGYTTLKTRGEKLLDATTYDAVSDWSSELVNGAIAWRYE